MEGENRVGTVNGEAGTELCMGVRASEFGAGRGLRLPDEHLVCEVDSKRRAEESTLQSTASKGEERGSGEQNDILG